MKKKPYSGLSNADNDLIKYQYMASNRFENNEDVKYQEIFITYVTFHLQKHIIEKEKLELLIHMNEIDKLEFCGFEINQMLKTTRIMMVTQMSYLLTDLY
jgi:hypothetical protein